MARRLSSQQGQSYPYLANISDPMVQAALKFVMDQINSLRQPSSVQDQGGNRITGIATPTEASDAANKSYVDAVADPARIRKALSGSGSAPLDVSSLRGRLSTVQRPFLLLIEAGATPPTNAQDGELIFQLTNGFLRFNGKTGAWDTL